MLLAPAAWGLALAASELARSRAAYLAGEDFLAIWDSVRRHEASLPGERKESACFWISPPRKRHFAKILASEREKQHHFWISA